MSRNTPAVLTGRMIGAFRLQVLIKACEVEATGLKMTRGPSALSILKRELRVKGNREGVLKYAREVAATVADW